MNSLEWLQFLLSFFVQASLVLSTAWALERWADATTIKSRIWTGCFVSILVLLVMGLLLPRLHWFQPWSQLGPESLLVVANTQHIVGRCLLALWILGCSAMLVRWIFQFWDMRRFIRSCGSVDTESQVMMRRLAPDSLLKPGNRPIEFKYGPEELGPFCYQFHEPIVFLPKSLIHGDTSELQHILLHELTHLKTLHPVQLFAQKLAQVVLWFHPLIWISGKRAHLVREFVCDDAASSEQSSTASYLRTLLHIVEQRTLQPGSTFSIGRSPSELKIRARRLLSPRVLRVPKREQVAFAALLVLNLMISQLWLPTNPLASPSARFSPWPSWSAATLHLFNFPVRDFEPFSQKLQMHELLEHSKEIEARRS